MQRDVAGARAGGIVRRAFGVARRRRGAVSELRAVGPPRGRALISYLHEAVTWAEDDPRLAGHTNRWESREIAHILARLGFNVQAVDFSERSFQPKEGFDVVVAIEGELVRLARAARAPVGLLHLTGSHPAFQNAAEQRRLAELDERRGVRCVARRVVSGERELDEALELARGCTLLGNETTLATYPARWRERITCVSVTASVLRSTRTHSEMRAAGDGFLWYFGSGAVHKGLDRALEAFARRPELRLHVVGSVADEEDFAAAYAHELGELPNVHLHGRLDPASARFAEVAADCGFVLAPTCSEGMSPAVATMLVFGLYPVLSRQTGITLPAGCGRYLGDCSVTDVESSCAAVASLSLDDRAEQTLTIQRDALARYSRERFTQDMTRHFERLLS